MRKSFFVQIGDVGLFDVHLMDVEMHIDVRGADALAEFDGLRRGVETLDSYRLTTSSSSVIPLFAAVPATWEMISTDIATPVAAFP
jgi:hypothetical protein